MGLGLRRVLWVRVSTNVGTIVIRGRRGGGKEGRTRNEKGGEEKERERRGEDALARWTTTSTTRVGRSASLTTEMGVP